MEDIWPSMKLTVQRWSTIGTIGHSLDSRSGIVYIRMFSFRSEEASICFFEVGELVDCLLGRRGEDCCS